MGLLPLEFTDGLTDSPYFRDKIQSHERELDRMNQAIKSLIKEVKDLLSAARSESIDANHRQTHAFNDYRFVYILDKH